VVSAKGEREEARSQHKQLIYYEKIEMFLERKGGRVGQETRGRVRLQLRIASLSRLGMRYMKKGKRGAKEEGELRDSCGIEF